MTRHRPGGHRRSSSAGGVPVVYGIPRRCSECGALLAYLTPQLWGARVGPEVIVAMQLALPDWPTREVLFWVCADDSDHAGFLLHHCSDDELRSTDRIAVTEVVEPGARGRSARSERGTSREDGTDEGARRAVHRVAGPLYRSPTVHL